MLLPIFNELGRTDLSLAFVPQRRISVFSLFIFSLFADIHKLMSSVSYINAKGGGGGDPLNATTKHRKFGSGA